MEYLHKGTFKQIVCIWCGMYLPAVEALRAHGLKCAIKQANLSEESWSLCTFCPTIFFFSDLTKSPFFIAHMNNQHRKRIEPSWSFPCARCNSIFPTIEAAEHHRKLCYKSIPKIILKGHHQVPENSLQITSATSIMKPKSMLMPSLKPLVTYQVCGLCSKTITGIVGKSCHFRRMPRTLLHDWLRIVACWACLRALVNMHALI